MLLSMVANDSNEKLEQWAQKYSGKLGTAA